MTVAARGGKLATGEIFAGRYEVEELLGQGGMGRVYEVYDRDVGDRVALKILRASGDDELVDRLRREVRLARRITHPNVARIHDLGEADGLHYLTMELISGTSLEPVIASEAPLSPGRAATVSLAVARALEAAHQGGVVHRDLKPSNVLLEEHGRVVLTDFGIARAVVDSGDLLRTSGSIGTPAYMAPELVTGDPADERTDVYALGLLLYELVTGQRPFAGATALATAMARLDRPAPDPRTLRSVPDPLALLILHCLERDPRRRPRRAAQVAERLADFTRSEHTEEATLATLPAGVAKVQPPPPARGATLAVLPIRFRGDPAHAYVADAVTDELVDVLCRTRGLRVLASGTTARFRDSRDPLNVGRELGADHVADATLQLSGERVRISARLCDARSGLQLWSHQFEGAVGEIFELQEKLALRVAEGLRLELSTAQYSGAIPREACEAYAQARRLVGRHGYEFGGPGTALRLLDRCVELAPEFAPALAAHAKAALHAWFIPSADQASFEDKAKKSVRRALEQAPDLAETHIAAGKLAVQEGNFRDAALALGRALEIAPTCAAAHEYLGALQCEAGHADEGMRRLRLALELEPSLGAAWGPIARVSALRGDREGFQFARDRLLAALGDRHPASVTLAARVAAWDQDRDELRRLADMVAEETAPAIEFLSSYLGLFLGEVTFDQAHEKYREAIAASANRRLISYFNQLALEGAVFAEQLEAARELLAALADGILIDLEWLEHCPRLEGIRGTPEYAEALHKVRSRADAIRLV